MNGALILGYHRIEDSDSDPFNVCVSPEYFHQHLEVISRLACPERLGELVADLQYSNVRKGTVVVTFDDGYADFARNAMPLLEKVGVPATLFVSTGSLGHQFWWEELRQVVFSADPLSDVLNMRLNGGGLSWTYRHDEAARAPSAIREDLLSDLYQKMLPMPARNRTAALAELREQIGRPQGDGSCFALTHDEVVGLSRSGLVEVGAHTVTHPVLAAMPHSVQNWEISESKRRLEELINRPVTAFSYPNGSWSYMSEKLVKGAGFSCACGSQFDVVRKRSNRYHLPRFWAENRDGEWLARHLRRWLRV